MKTIDLEAFERSVLKRDPCDYIMVPGFIKADALQAINRDYPEIGTPGNFPPDQLEYGPAFRTLLDELNSEILRQRYCEKFGLDLSGYPLQITVRKFSAATDGNVHNDSRNKIITTLIYFNREWHHEGGKLRLLHSSWNIENYAEEIEPVGGTLVAFRRNERSFHGFKAMEGERRSLQMYWVKPERLAPGARKPVGIKKVIKRMLKRRPR